MPSRPTYEVAYWPNPPGGFPTLYRRTQHRVYEYQLPERGLLKIAEVAAVFGVTTKTIWRWSSPQRPGERPRFRVVTVNGRRGIRAGDVLRYLAKHGGPKVRRGRLGARAARSIFLGG